MTSTSITTIIRSLSTTSTNNILPNKYEQQYMLPNKQSIEVKVNFMELINDTINKHDNDSVFQPLQQKLMMVNVSSPKKQSHVKSLEPVITDTILIDSNSYSFDDLKIMEKANMNLYIMVNNLYKEHVKVDTNERSILLQYNEDSKRFIIKLPEDENNVIQDFITDNGLMRIKNYDEMIGMSMTEVREICKKVGMVMVVNKVRKKKGELMEEIGTIFKKYIRTFDC
jgi:hypothetical protein